MLTAAQCEHARNLLEELGDRIRHAVEGSRRDLSIEQMAEVAAVTEADTIYGIDKVSEELILEWLDEHWPAELACELVMEGLEEERVLPHGVAPVTKLILDPIDGTRGLMYDKRSAWALAGLALHRGDRTSLQDIQVAVMTELPTARQTDWDQLSAIRGGGIRGRRRARPSQATDFSHGFASFAKFFPQGKALIAAIEEDFWAELYGREPGASPLIFDDQYLSTGGQIYELSTGRDRFVADIRPLVFEKIGLKVSLTCHPYDICTAIVLTELGGIVETPEGRPVDAPLDTVHPVSWIGFANEDLARLARPALHRALKKHL
ncbi:MAG: inositol monophosphatase [Acidobacteria bacterium]|nr:inositol monophosphatase [Acidobacteriota bacterium]